MDCDITGVLVAVQECDEQTAIDVNESREVVRSSNQSYLPTDSSTNFGFEGVDINCGSRCSNGSKFKTPPQAIGSHQSSGSSMKICETDCGEERDTFSPVSSNSSPSGHLKIPVEVELLKCNVDNKIFEKKNKHTTLSSAISTTKEEKQRQNEEIVIMETSSISSETGSWESIFPNQEIITEADIRKCCNDFLQNERQHYYSGVEKSTNTAACFIDASSLRDEEEEQQDFVSPGISTNSRAVCEEHMESFEFCKATRSSHNEKKKKNSCSLSDESPQTAEESDQINNLSDEEKLSIKRDKTNGKDVFGTYLFQPTDINAEQREGSSSSNESSSNEAVVVRKQYEKVQQFSGHIISPKLPCVNDISYTTDYSSSSPAASLVWSSDAERNQKSTLFLPDTPHNSIVQIHAGVEYRDSGAYCSDATDSPMPGQRTPKQFSKFDKVNPIFCGGVSIHDIKNRKTEACSIVSEGFMSLDFERTNQNHEEFKIRPKLRNAVASSWVVDMSDWKHEKETNSLSSVDNMSKSGKGSFISFEDFSKTEELRDGTGKKTSILSNAKKPQGFFVDVSGDYSSHNETSPPSLAKQKSSSNNLNDRKNIFSMFIDFGEKKIISKKEPFSLAALSSSFNLRRFSKDDHINCSTSSSETLMTGSNQKPQSYCDITGEGEFMKVTNENPPTSFTSIKRISKSVESNDPNRLSWTNNTNHTTTSAGYKRSASLTGDKELISIVDKIPLISKTSSFSVDSSLSPFEDLTSSKSEVGSTLSNTSTTSESGPDGAENNSGIMMKKHRRDVQLNETFDKSSVASLTDGLLSKDLSPISTATDTEDLTFHKVEEYISHESNEPSSHHQIKDVITRSLLMETIIETKETLSPKKFAEIYSPAHTMESLNATIEKQKKLLETVTENAVTESRSFVKLSDMDKPLSRFELHSNETLSKSVGNHRQINRLFHECSSTRPHSWTMTRSTGPSILNITNSVDNLRSLTRLFPQFSKELSYSLPNDFVGNVEMLHYENSTDFSINSSLTSSFSRSEIDESSISLRQPRRLGEDLLKMFLQELATDMIVEVNGRCIKAHKCILRSRCQYFAAMLAGEWGQNSGNVSLPGYSYSAVHFALCHIYSGASHPPDGISLMELAALADLLGLEGLKEVTAHAMKNNYCHNFHKPCSGCIDGILQVLPVALNHALDDLYRKCLKWTCRHYVKVWPTRSFAQLPSDILFRCRQQIVAYLTSETVLDSVLDCDNLLAQLAPFRWASVIGNLVRDILDVTYSFIANHFSSLIASDSFLSLGHDKSCNIQRLSSLLIRTASSLTPDQACRSYQRITRLNTVLSSKTLKIPNLADLAKELQGLNEEELEWNDEFIRLISAILAAVEQCLTRQCSRAMRVNAWQRMDLELRKKIQTLARLTEPNDLRKRNAVTKSFSFGSSSARNQDLYQVKLAIQSHSKRSLAYDSQLLKAISHTQTHAQELSIQTIEKGVQANNDSNESEGKVLKTSSRAHILLKAKLPKNHTNEKNSSYRRTQSEASAVRITCQKQIKNNIDTVVGRPFVSRLTEIQPRYLDPRKHRGTTNSNYCSVRSQTSSSIPLSLTKGKHISSSDSSRNSSPAIHKNIANPDRKIGTISINMSLDSLTSPSRRNKAKCKSSNQYSDTCVDSLADSMKSSMITDKTISQESLSRSKFTRSNPVISKKLVLRQLKNQKVPQTASNRPLPKGRQNSSHNITSAGSSPSSLTNKSGSRLSSVGSMNSPRDVLKYRSISVPVNQSATGTGRPTPSIPRKSFISAKSREILARRAEKNKQQQSTIGEESNQGLLKEGIGRVSMPISNRHTHSNIPTRRPNSLCLKKSHVGDQRNKNNRCQETHKSKFIPKSATTNGSSKIEFHIDAPPLKETKTGFIESKLDRSSTFCKDSADLAKSGNVLRIIE